jgi:hypothetical protein
MCDPVSLAITAAAVGGTWAYGNYKNNKEKDKASAKVQAANKLVQEQVEQNKIANSVQSTEELKNPTLAEQLKQQKVPLNTGSTGVSTANPTSVGLNLGGY